MTIEIKKSVKPIKYKSAIDILEDRLEQIKVNKNKPVLVCILDKSYIKKYYELVNELRENNIASEVYLDQNKNLKKQLQYADRKKIDLAIICGENEC